MTEFSPYANFGYVSLIKEATAGTPVIPTGYLRIVGESVVPSFEISSVQEIAGSRERNIRSIPGKIEISGDIEFYVEPKMIGHFLRGLLGAPTTQTLTALTAFRHTFEVTDSPQTYTIDIQPADAPWVHRFYGVQITKITLEDDDNKIKCTASISPRKAFITARATADKVAGTSLLVDQTAGLVVGDSILVLKHEDGVTTQEEHLIAALPSDTEITTTAAITAVDETDIIVIKRATASYVQDPVFVWFGGSQVYTGDDIDNVAVACKETFSLEYSNDTEPRFCSGKEESARYPSDIITKGYTVEGKLSKFYNSEANLDKLRKNIKLAVRVLFQGETALEANALVKAKTFWGAANGFEVEATTGGKAGNDYNVTLVMNTIDTLAASISGNNILVQLASTTAANNTGTLIAVAINALTGVDSVAEGTGATEFTAAVDNQNLGDTITGATAAVVGRDASEKSYMQCDFAAGKMDSYFPSANEDDILQEEIPFTFYKDVESGDQSKKWSSKIRLVNSISAY